jgi:adenylosuccinate lyase
MDASPEFETYQSPFTWRYGSPEMRRIWSEKNKRLTWRNIWVRLARAEQACGLVTSEQVADLEAHAPFVDILRSLEIESEIHHDLVAEVRAFAEQCPIGGKIIHAGATSMDVKDNAEVLQMRESLDLLLERLAGLLRAWSVKVKEFADTPCIAFTHLQPAEPTTLGYRFALYAQDLLEDLDSLRRLRQDLRGKGFKGAVGTSASYEELVGADGLERFEALLGEALGLEFYPATAQTYPRKQDYTLLSALAGLGGSISKFAADLRLLQSAPVGELFEPFGESQVGSSAMPFKRNPVKAEEINSLARALAQMPLTAWHNAANSFLERTLDDSANRRTLLPEAFLACDELLEVAGDIVEGLGVNLKMVERNLAEYAPFANTERLLMTLVKAGADRQEMHERLRGLTLRAWEDIQAGRPGGLLEKVLEDETIHGLLDAAQVKALIGSGGYTGRAGQRAREMAERIGAALKQD